MANRNQVLSETIIRAWNKGETGFYIQTSGSTGEPKSIMLEREKIIWSAKQTAIFLGILPTDSIYCCLPVTRVGGWMQVARALVWNTPLKVVEPSSNPLLNYTGNYTITSLTPAQLYTILENQESRQMLNRFRIVLIGGGDVSKNLEHQVSGMNPVFYHTYGMTETYSHIAMRKFNFETQFKPLPETELKLNASDCLCIKNYLTNQEWLETNDMAKLSPQGFEILGRADNVINSGGIKIRAEEIEKMLTNQLSLPEGSFFYASKPDDKFGEKPVLIINKKKLQSLPAWEHLFADFPYSKPREIIYLEDFIYTETGKIQRKNTLQK